MGNTMAQPVKLNFSAPRRGLPPKHFADLSNDERIAKLEELGLPYEQIDAYLTGREVPDEVAEAIEKTGADVSVAFVPPAFTKDAMVEAIEAVLSEGNPQVLTRDVGGQGTTESLGKAIAERLRG